MTNLPLNIGNMPAPPAVNKPAGNSDTPQPGAQNFENVLSRQVAESEKPDEASPSSSGETGTQSATVAENTAINNIDDKNSALPADMLAILLAQQNQMAIPQPVADTQPLTSTQTGTNTPDNPTMKKRALSALPVSDDGKPASTVIPELNTATRQIQNNTQIENPVKIENPAQGKNQFDHALSALAAIEAIPTEVSPTLRANVISDLSAPAQQPGLSPAVTVATAVSNTQSLATPLTHPAWGDEFSQKITWMATQHTQSAELHLNPPQLGPLDVVLKMNGDQATAMFTSPHAAVREAIEQALPKLREMLADNGIMLGNAMVSDHSAKNNADSTPRNSQHGSAISTINGTVESSDTQEVRVSPISRHLGMVDTFA